MSKELPQPISMPALAFDSSTLLLLGAKATGDAHPSVFDKEANAVMAKKNLTPDYIRALFLQSLQTGIFFSQHETLNFRQKVNALEASGKADRINMQTLKTLSTLLTANELPTDQLSYLLLAQEATHLLQDICTTTRHNLSTDERNAPLVQFIDNNSASIPLNFYSLPSLKEQKAVKAINPAQQKLRESGGQIGYNDELKEKGIILNGKAAASEFMRPRAELVNTLMTFLAAASYTIKARRQVNILSLDNKYNYMLNLIKVSSSTKALSAKSIPAIMPIEMTSVATNVTLPAFKKAIQSKTR